MEVKHDWKSLDNFLVSEWKTTLVVISVVTGSSNATLGVLPTIDFWPSAVGSTVDHLCPVW